MIIHTIKIVDEKETECISVRELPSWAESGK